jgi:F-type H+-transporting ATPase subunit epsilon
VLTRIPTNSYNRYLAVASRVVRRSLKEDKRVIAERRGESDLRFAKWQVSLEWSIEERRAGSFSRQRITAVD